MLHLQKKIEDEEKTRDDYKSKKGKTKTLRLDGDFGKKNQCRFKI